MVRPADTPNQRSICRDRVDLPRGEGVSQVRLVRVDRHKSDRGLGYLKVEIPNSLGAHTDVEHYQRGNPASS